LHNDTAKTNGIARAAFCNALGDACAGGARLVALNANMAMFGVVPAMAARGV
jgi:hypothetical protein